MNPDVILALGCGLWVAVCLGCYFVLISDINPTSIDMDRN